MYLYNAPLIVRIKSEKSDRTLMLIAILKEFSLSHNFKKYWLTMNVLKIYLLFAYQLQCPV